MRPSDVLARVSAALPQPLKDFVRPFVPRDLIASLAERSRRLGDRVRSSDVPRRVSAALPQPLKDFARPLLPRNLVARFAGRPQALHVTSPPKAPPQARSRSFPHPLEQRLWSGFGGATARELEAIQSRWSTKPSEMGAAAWALARWYVARGAHERALQQLYTFRVALPKIAPKTPAQALEIDCLTALGRFEDAEQAVAQGLESGERVHEICFAAANLHHMRAVRDGGREAADQARVDWFNRVLEGAGLAGIRLADPAKPLTIDNLTTAPLPADPEAGAAKVSVLMPAYNCTETVGFAARSVLAQTWANLELVIVDDASTDDTWAVLEKLAAEDSRIRPIRHERNRGAYGARNTALEAATGDYVTVQDSDDWGHPEKLALQMRAILKDGQRFNATAYLRVGQDLEVLRKPNLNSLLSVNLSSILFSRDDLIHLGGWDEVWMEGDAELETRFGKRFGVQLARLKKDLPLTLALSRKLSLTNHSALGVASVKYGARAEYRECRTYWHQLELAKETPDLTLTRTGRPFPAPRICLYGRSDEPQRFDVLFVSDFTLPDTETVSDLPLRLAGRRIGLNQACMHWPRIENIGKAHNAAGRAQIHEGIVSVVVPEESIECDLVVSDALVLQNLPDKALTVRAKSCVIVCPRSAARASGDGETSFDVERAIANARTAFGVEPVLAPMLASVREALAAAAANSAFTATDWTPLAGHPAEASAEAFAERIAPYVTLAGERRRTAAE